MAVPTGATGRKTVVRATPTPPPRSGVSGGSFNRNVISPPASRSTVGPPAFRQEEDERDPRYLGFNATDDPWVLRQDAPGGMVFDPQDRYYRDDQGRGVPLNYVARPLYTRDNLADIVGMPPSAVASLQDELISVGLLDGRYTRGLVDKKTMDAYEDLLTLSNYNGLSVRQTMGWLRQSPYGGAGGKGRGGGGRGGRRGGGGGGARGPSIRLSNPADLKKLAQNVAFQLTGRRDSGVDADAFVQAYQAAERAMQQQLIAGAAEVTEPQDPQSMAEDMVRNQVGDQVQARSVVDKAGTLFNMMANEFGIVR